MQFGVLSGHKNESRMCPTCGDMFDGRRDMGTFLFNKDGSLHGCDREDSVEEINPKDLPEDIIKQYEANANEPSTMSKRQHNFLTTRKNNIQRAREKWYDTKTNNRVKSNIRYYKIRERSEGQVADKMEDTNKK